jgi:hypothetical protein
MMSGLCHQGRPGLQAQNQVSTVKTMASANEIGTPFMNVLPTSEMNASTSSNMSEPLPAGCPASRFHAARGPTLISGKRLMGSEWEPQQPQCRFAICDN